MKKAVYPALTFFLLYLLAACTPAPSLGASAPPAPAAVSSAPNGFLQSGAAAPVPPAAAAAEATFMRPVAEYTQITADTDGDTHNGLVITLDEGSAILSIGDGTVLESSSTASWGNYVLIEHGNGFVSRYSSNKEN